MRGKEICVDLESVGRKWNAGRGFNSTVVLEKVFGIKEKLKIKTKTRKKMCEKDIG